ATVAPGESGSDASGRRAAVRQSEPGAAGDGRSPKGSSSKPAVSSIAGTPRPAKGRRMRAPGIRDSIGRDAAEESTGLRSIEPRTAMVTRRDPEAIVPSRDGVGQETTAARDGPGTVRGLSSNLARVVSPGAACGDSPCDNLTGPSRAASRPVTPDSGDQGRAPRTAPPGPGESPPMAAIAADRNLLFGLIALQNALIDQDQLVDAFRAWTRDKGRALADHLVALGHLNAAQRTAIEALAALHVEKYGDTERSLAAIPAGRSTREDLARIGDPDLGT